MRLDPKDDPLQAEIEAREIAEAQKDCVRARASATPMPGPLRDAFAPVLDLKVGPYSVRPVFDADVDLLQSVSHPLAETVMDLLTTGRAEVKSIPRGPDAWLAAWMFTRSVDEAEQGFKDKTCRDKARAEFGRLQIAALLQLHEAVSQQVVRYTETMVAYDRPENKREEGDPVPPSGAVQPGTDSAGSSRSGAASCTSTAGAPTT